MEISASQNLSNSAYKREEKINKEEKDGSNNFLFSSE